MHHIEQITKKKIQSFIMLKKYNSNKKSIISKYFPDLLDFQSCFLSWSEDPMRKYCIESGLMYNVKSYFFYFRTLLDGNGEPIGDNYRPPQPLNGRSVTFYG